MKTREKNGTRRRFSLIELLVVIAIVATLVSILTPALAKARNMAKQIGCVSNLKQLGAAMTLYAGDNNDFLPPFQDPCWDQLVASYVQYKYYGKINGVRKGNSAIFHCPAGVTPAADYDITFSRGYAMNKYIGTNYEGVNIRLSLSRPKNAEQWLLMDGWTNGRELGLFGTIANIEYFSTAFTASFGRRHAGSSVNYARKDGSVAAERFANSIYGDDLIWFLYANGQYYQAGQARP